LLLGLLKPFKNIQITGLPAITLPYGKQGPARRCHEQNNKNTAGEVKIFSLVQRYTGYPIINSADEVNLFDINLSLAYFSNK